MYQPVLEVRAKQWMLGKIQDHQVRPLTKEEIEELCVMLNVQYEFDTEGTGFSNPLEQLTEKPNMKTFIKDAASEMEQSEEEKDIEYVNSGKYKTPWGKVKWSELSEPAQREVRKERLKNESELTESRTSYNQDLEPRTSYTQDLKGFASKVAQIVLGVPAGQPWLFRDAIHALKKKYHTLPEPEGFPQPSGELGRILELEKENAKLKDQLSLVMVVSGKTKEDYHDLLKGYDECIDIAWGIIANAIDAWGLHNIEWCDAAAKWRDTYLPETSRRNAERAKLTEEPVSLPESIHKKFAENVSRILTGNIDATREPLTLHVLEATIRILMSDSWAYMESRKGSVMNFNQPKP